MIDTLVCLGSCLGCGLLRVSAAVVLCQQTHALFTVLHVFVKFSVCVARVCMCQWHVTKMMHTASQLPAWLA